MTKELNPNQGPAYLKFLYAIHQRDEGGFFMTHNKNLLTFWRNNLVQLKRMLTSLPNENLLLDHWGESRSVSCSSVACVGGWSTVWPHFAEMGVKRTSQRDWEPTLVINDAVFPLHGLSLSAFLFGSAIIFSGKRDNGLSDKEEAMQRIDMRLSLVKDHLNN